ncbi:MAG TPA: J domain-containing protein [Caulobacteraceae bacterium]|nr:J domain-containing protein [Caulobacteraceae bacterium]
MAQDPYVELGVARTASADEVRKAFRKLAKKHHPDANQGDASAEEKFKRISAAFDILGDPEKRTKFDAGEIDADGRETARAYGGAPFGGDGQGFRSGNFAGNFEGVDINDILGEMFGARGGRGGGGGPFGRSDGGAYPSRGSDLRAEVEIELADAIHGGRTRIAFSDGRMLDVTIPKGATDGQVLRLRGQGSPGRAGAGDALIELKIKPHARWRREGDNLTMELPVSVPDAVLGGKVEVETPDGSVTLTVPRHANSGAVLRLKGRGAPLGGGRRGDLLARLVVMLPETIDPELEQIAQTWREERPYAPRRQR